MCIRDSTQPVTADGDSVGLILDKGQWGRKTLEQVLAAQTELRGNGTIGLVGSATAATYNTATGAGTATRVDGSNQSFVTVPVTGGKAYRVQITNTGAASIFLRNGLYSEGTAIFLVPASSSISYIVTALSSVLSVTTIAAASSVAFTITSIKEVPGYHRTQATGTSMPKHKTDGTLHWLLYDGTDDGHSTGPITWGTDEVAVCAGITKSSDAATGVIAELSASSNSNNGAFTLYNFVSDTKFYFESKGTTKTGAATGALAAPVTAVLTGLGDISGDSTIIRKDGVEITETTTDQGTGNFGSYPLYFGRRGGSSLPFNGREYQTVIRSRLLSTAELSSLETFIAAKTGVTL